VFEDADIEKAIEGLVVCKFRNAGQTCVCANRIYVHDSVHDDFVEKLSKEAEVSLTVGDGTLPGVTMGPLINAKGVEKVKAHIDNAVENGAEVVLGGEPIEILGDNFFAPTVLTGVTPDMACSIEETFGPVASVIRFNSEDEVISMANNTKAGLAAYFYTKDLSRSFRVSEALEYGMVAVNEGVLSTEVAPFGGIKESGCGREGSKYGMDDYMEIKYTLLGGI
jgi:succinate-semialdehyde dehydrogenase/glutarate-semialdehyde dehydrogenase